MNATHRLLREATAENHARVDAAFGGLDLTSRDGYGLFLEAQAKAFLPLEAAVEATAAVALLDDWSARKRGPALIADLHAMAMDVPPPLSPPEISSSAEAWGTLYVLEGSRLGGQMLSRLVPADAPRSFLSHAAAAGAWRKLLDLLDRTLVLADDRQRAVTAARRAFLLFEDAARHEKARLA
jgi:heme oxygenase